MGLGASSRDRPRTISAAWCGWSSPSRARSRGDRERARIRNDEPGARDGRAAGRPAGRGLRLAPGRRSRTTRAAAPPGSARRRLADRDNRGSRARHKPADRAHTTPAPGRAGNAPRAADRPRRPARRRGVLRRVGHRRRPHDAVGHEERHLTVGRHRARSRAAGLGRGAGAEPASALFGPAGRGSAQGRAQRAAPSGDARRARLARGSLRRIGSRGPQQLARRLGAPRAGAPDARGPRDVVAVQQRRRDRAGGRAARRHRDGSRRLRAARSCSSRSASATPRGFGRRSTACPTPAAGSRCARGTWRSSAS